MAPKKAAAEMSTNTSSGKELAEGQTTDVHEAVSKVVKKVSAHPPTMVMVKEALMVLDQRKGVSAQAIRNFIRDKYRTVAETQLKTMVRKALLKGIDSGVLVRPANSTATGAQGRFRLAVRKPKVVKRKANENANPNVKQDKEPQVTTGDTTVTSKKKTKSAAVGEDETKKKVASASKVAPAKRPKAKRATRAAADAPEPKTLTDDKKGVKKQGRKAVQKSPVSERNLGKKGEEIVEEGGNEAEVMVRRKKGGTTTTKVTKAAAATGAKKGKKAAEK